VSHGIGKAIDLLVMVSCMHYCTSTSILSTLYSSGGLPDCSVDISSWGRLHA